MLRHNGHSRHRQRGVIVLFQYRSHFAGRCAFGLFGCLDFKISTTGGPPVFFAAAHNVIGLYLVSLHVRVTPLEGSLSFQYRFHVAGLCASFVFGLYKRKKIQRLVGLLFFFSCTKTSSGFTWCHPKSKCIRTGDLVYDIET